MLSYTFSGTAVLLGTAIVLGFLAVIWIWGKRYFQMKSPEAKEQGSRTKYQRVDVFRFQPTFLRLGLICALAFSFLAFNFTQFENGVQFVQMGTIEQDPFIDQAPPITQHTPPPPPPPPKFKAVDDPMLPDTITFRSMDVSDTTAIAAVVVKRPVTRVAPPPPPPIPVDEPPYWVIVEEMPVFGDCQSETSKELRKQCSDRAIIDFINKHIRYPVMAKENSVSGTAVVRFVVEKDGSLTDIEIVRDPGAGLGGEAARVVELMANTAPKWTPGKQTGRPVRVQFNLPVRFQLQ